MASDDPAMTRMLDTPRWCSRRGTRTTEDAVGLKHRSERGLSSSGADRTGGSLL